MKLDPEELKKLSEKDPQELSDKITQISSMLGIDSRRIMRMLGSPEDIQKKLKNMSESDIRRMTDSIDPSVLDKLKGGDR